MFGQILDKLDSWLGRSFLLARYFPWLLFFAGNLLFAAVELPEVRAFVLAEYSQLASTDKIVDLFLALSAIAVLAFTLSPATNVITRLLEGESLPVWLAAPLVLRRTLEVQRLVERNARLFQSRAGLDDTDALEARLAQMRKAGARHRAITDPERIGQAEAEIERLGARRYLNRPIAGSALAMAVQALAAALERNCAELTALKPPVSARDLAWSRKLDRLHGEMVYRIAPYTIDIAQHHEALASDRYNKLYAGAVIAPTRLGNDVAALRGYCETRYGLDFDFFWPRLQLALKDQKLVDKLATAKIQVDFSILSLTLCVLFALIWLGLLACFGTSPYSLLLYAGLVPPLFYFWLWMVHESYSAYAELVRSAIDLCRFDLLGALRRPLPASTGAEREVWKQAGLHLAVNEQEADIPFRHPAS